jgi:hypothetical protein
MPGALKALNDMLSLAYEEAAALTETFRKLNEFKY